MLGDLLRFTDLFTRLIWQKTTSYVRRYFHFQLYDNVNGLSIDGHFDFLMIRKISIKIYTIKLLSFIIATLFHLF